MINLNNNRHYTPKNKINLTQKRYKSNAFNIQEIPQQNFTKSLFTEKIHVDFKNNQPTLLDLYNQLEQKLMNLYHITEKCMNKYYNNLPLHTEKICTPDITIHTIGAHNTHIDVKNYTSDIFLYILHSLQPWIPPLYIVSGITGAILLWIYHLSIEYNLNPFSMEDIVQWCNRSKISIYAKSTLDTIWNFYNVKGGSIKIWWFTEYANILRTMTIPLNILHWQRNTVISYLENDESPILRRELRNRIRYIGFLNVLSVGLLYMMYSSDPFIRFLRDKHSPREVVLGMLEQEKLTLENTINNNELMNILYNDWLDYYELLFLILGM